MTTAALLVPPAVRRRSLRVDVDSAAAAVIFTVLAVCDLVLQPSLADLDQIGLFVGTTLPLLLLAAGQTFVILIRGIDLSVGGTFAIASVITASANGGSSGYIVLALAVAAACGLVNGLLVGVAGMQSFIVTLATWTVFNGIALKIMSTDGGLAPPAAVSLVNGNLGRVPMSLVLLAALLVGWFLVRRSRFGHRVIAVGSDTERARLNGARTRFVVVLVFVIAALLAGLAGVVSAGLTDSGTPTGGDPYILTSVAAVVIGGTSLRGGKGGVGLSVLGALSLALISDIVAALNLDIWVATAASSGLLLVLVLGRATVSRLLGRSSRV
jgi:ribose transport system permease protein